MRAVCSICSDHFDGHKPISAIPCGHTFHDSCLEEWFQQSQTCPHCRKKVNRKHIIHKLYFDAPEDESDSAADTGPLHNEISSLKLKIQEKERHHADYVAQIKALEARIGAAQSAQKSAEQLCRQERVHVSELRQQLKHFKKSEELAEEAQKDASKVRQELKNLQAVRKVITGCAEEVQQIISEGCDPKQLATWCSILKKEHALKKTECKSLRDSLEQTKKEVVNKDKKLKFITKELESNKEQLKHSEDDLKNAELLIASLKKKMDLMKKSNHVNDLDRIIMESPAPCPPMKRPRLSDPFGESSLEMDTKALGLFASPSPPHKESKSRPSQPAQTFSISSAASKLSPVKKAKRNVQDISNIPGLGQFNILQKQRAYNAPQHGTRIRQGYNGFGGHEKFVAFGKGGAKPVVKKAPTHHLKPRSVSSGSLPPLPQLDNLIVLDSD